MLIYSRMSCRRLYGHIPLIERACLAIPTNPKYIALLSLYFYFTESHVSSHCNVWTHRVSIRTADLVLFFCQTNLVVYSTRQNKHIVCTNCGGGHRSYGFSSQCDVSVTHSGC